MRIRLLPGRPLTVGALVQTYVLRATSDADGAPRLRARKGQNPIENR